ncbi:DUF4403 family protein [Spirosoma pomorum]
MKPRLATGFLLLLLLVLASNGCQRVRPKAPYIQDFDPAIEDPVSYVAGQITFSIPALERKVNEALKPMLVTEEAFEGKKGEAWHIRVERTGPVRIRYANQKVSFSAPLRVWYTNPIGLRKKRKSRELCALAVNFVSPLAVGSGWRLTTKSRFEDYRWIHEPKVRLLGIKIGVTKLADSILDKRKADIEEAIDDAVHSELRLDKEVGKIWRDIQKPLRICKAPEEIWVVPKPFSVAVAPIHGNKRAITVPIQIALRAATKLGDEPEFEPEPLPRLLRHKTLPEASRLRVLAFVPYEGMTKVLSQEVKQRKLNLMNGAVTIKDASVYGSGRSLIVKTDVGGTVKGTLYFRGQPVFDTLTNTLRVRYVDFDVDTKERLLSTADWLLHDNLRDTLEKSLVVPMSQQLAEVPVKIETAFAQGGAGKKTILDINAFRMVPQKIVVRPDGIQVLIKVESKVAVVVKHL